MKYEQALEYRNKNKEKYTFKRMRSKTNNEIIFIRELQVLRKAGNDENDFDVYCIIGEHEANAISRGLKDIERDFMFI